MSSFIIIFVALSVYIVEAEDTEEVRNIIEARGKGKYALLIHFFYVAAAKLFILKIVYGILFYALLIKGWHFVLWFVSYIKKDKHVDYIEHEPTYDHSHHEYHDNYDHHGPHYGYHDNYDHGPYHGYEKTGKGVIEYEPSNKKKVYDSDGSYSVPLV